MAMIKKEILAAFAAAFFVVQQLSAAWSVQVFERGERRPLAGAVGVNLSGTVVAESGNDGRLLIEANGDTLWVRAEGFAELALPLGVTPPSRVFLSRVDYEGDEVRVQGRREAQISRSEIAAEKFRKVAGGGGDALRALRTLPGVASVGDFSGQLAVRGGGPQDNLNYLDDIPWPVPYHFGGVLTTINGDLLDSVSLLAGGYPARWGGSDGAVIDARSRPGKRDRWHGATDMNLVTASFLAEGPLSSSAAPKSSITISGRRSYFDLILPRLGVMDITAAPYFWDLGATWSYDPGPNDELRAILLATDDQLGFLIQAEDVRQKEFQGEFRFNNRFVSSGLNWRHRGPIGRWRFTPYVYQITFETRFGQGYFTVIRPTISGLDAEYESPQLSVLGRHKLATGALLQYQDYLVSAFSFRRSNGAGSGVTTVSDPQGVNVTGGLAQGGVFVEDRFELGSHVKGSLGWRYDRSGPLASALAPRLQLEYSRGRDILRGAWGIFARPPSGRESAPIFGNPDLGPNLTEHAVLGYERRLNADWTGKVEAYYKTYRDNVVEVPDGRIFSNEGFGFARGVELFVRYDDQKRFFGWLSYAYSSSERRDSSSGRWAPYRYDQPHIATMVSSWRITPSFEFGGTFRYSSGSLITPVLGAIYDSINDLYLPIYGAPFSQRLPDYQRLDIRLEKTWRFEMWKLSAYVEVINLLNSPNPISRDYNRDYSRYQDVNQIPRLPYFGLTANF